MSKKIMKSKLRKVTMVSQERGFYWSMIAVCSMFDPQFVWVSFIMKPLNGGDGYKVIS